MATPTWPVLRTFDAAHLDRIALPLGGIGTGTISLGGRGDLRDFELGNRPAKGFRPGTGFFAVRARRAEWPGPGPARRGAAAAWLYEGAFGSPAANHGLPRFAAAGFDAAYPFGQVRLSDPDFPVRVTLQGFNPLVFGDVDRSSLPVAVLRHRLTNPTDEPVEATVALSLSNFVGANGTEDRTGGNVNHYRDGAGLAGITMTAPGLDPAAESAGEFTMALIRPDGPVSHRLGWADLSWGNSLLDFWDDLLDDGRLDPRTSAADRPVASLAGAVTLAPGSVRRPDIPADLVVPEPPGLGVDRRRRGQRLLRRGRRQRLQPGPSGFLADRPGGRARGCPSWNGSPSTRSVRCSPSTVRRRSPRRRCRT